MVDTYIKETEERMEKALLYAKQCMQRVRAGRASAEIVAHLRIDYYGVSTPLAQAASITVPDARSLHIKPWEKQLIEEIERAIRQSDLDIVPQNDSETIILNIPPLSEERRKQVLKQARNEIEQARIRIRGIRKDTNEHIKQDESLSEDAKRQANTSIQALTDRFIASLDELLLAKEKEIMQI